MHLIKAVNLDAWFTFDMLYSPVQNIYCDSITVFILTNRLFPNTLLNFQTFLIFCLISDLWLNFVMFRDHSVNAIRPLKFAETCFMTL